MGCRAGDGDCPDCFVADCLLLGEIFWTRVLSAFHLHDGSLSSMREGLVAQDSRVRRPPDLDSIYQGGRDGFSCLPSMPFGYWSWTKMSPLGRRSHAGRSWREQHRGIGFRARPFENKIIEILVGQRGRGL